MSNGFRKSGRSGVLHSRHNPGRASVFAKTCSTIFSIRCLRSAFLAFSAVPFGYSSFAQTGRIQVDRGTATVLVETYAPNIVRVSLSLRRDDALAAPWYRIVAPPTASGWRASSDEHGDTLKIRYADRDSRSAVKSLWPHTRDREVLLWVDRVCGPQHHQVGWHSFVTHEWVADGGA